MKKNISFLAAGVLGMALVFSLTASPILAQGALTATIIAPANNATFSVGQVINFSGAASGGTPSYGFLWNFGDSTSGAGANFNKSYTTPGTRTVTLTVTDFLGGQDTDQISVNIVTAGGDVTPPSAPQIIFSSHQAGATSTQNVVEIRWSQSTDIGSGVAGYSFVWDQNPLSVPDAIVETGQLQTTRTLGNGGWYFHLVAVDNAGNISTPVTHFGPIVIETAPDGGGAPVISNLRVTDITSTSVVIRWTTDRPATSRVIYDTESHDASAPPPNYGYGFSTETFDTDPMVMEHAVELTGLQPSTTYYFRAVSSN